MSVSDAWADLMSTLREKAPQTAESILPPPSPDVVRSVEASTGLDWPDELREFFSLHGGQPENNLGGDIFPRQELFGVERAQSDRDMMIEVWQGLADNDPDYYVGGYDALPRLHPEAGDPADAFLPQYVPVSGLDGYYYFCDTRPGPHNGCVRSYYQDGADPYGPLWASITDMLVGLRASIENGTAVDGWEPHFDGGAIEWLPEGTGDDAPAPEAPEPAVIHTGYDSPQVSLSDHDPDDPGADTAAIARAVMSAAAEKYGADRVGGAQTLIQWIPNAPGFVAGCVASVDGAQVFYAAVVTETPGQFQIHEIPRGGARFER